MLRSAWLSRRPPPRRRAPPAPARSEYGLYVAYALANLAVGAALVLGLRAFTGQFISVYIVNDATLAVLSLLQALVFHRWRAPAK